VAALSITIQLVDLAVRFISHSANANAISTTKCNSGVVKKNFVKQRLLWNPRRSVVCFDL